MSEMIDDFVGFANPLQNSVSIKQTSKGDWYCDGIKLYFGEMPEDYLGVLASLAFMQAQVTKMLKEMIANE